MVLVCGFCLLSTLALYTGYFRIYLTPFGKIDVDSYTCWLRQGLTNPVVCNQVRYGLNGFDIIHLGFQVTVRGLSYVSGLEHTRVLTLLIPIVVWGVIPFMLYRFMSVFFHNTKDGVYASLLLLFGTYTVFLFGIVAVWAQMFAYVFYLGALTAYLRFRRGETNLLYRVLVFAALSIMYHPYFIVFYGLFFLDWLGSKGLYAEILLILLGGVAFSTILGVRLINYTIFNPHFPPEPTIHVGLFFFTNPLIWLLAAYGFTAHPNTRRLPFYLIISCLLGVLGHNGRVLVAALPLLCAYAYLGLKTMLTHVKHKRVLVWLLVIMLLLYFSNTFSQYIHDMIIEMGEGRYFWPSRGFDPEPFKQLLSMNDG